MDKTFRKKWPIILLAAVLIAAGILAAVLLWPDDPSDPPVVTTLPQETEPMVSGNETEPMASGNETVPEESGVPMVTQYIVLSYPAELEELTQLRYENLPDGQQMIFTTDLTGQTLELFRFSVSQSGTEGYVLGTLTDEQAGELLVCVNVPEYTGGSWTPEIYAQLCDMQERVNDIIVQFYDDPRFTPA